MSCQPLETQVSPKILPPFNVILFDDDDHTYAYVIKMLQELFGHLPERAFTMAEEIDNMGKAIVWTGQKEHAEFHVERIHSMGADFRTESAGCMSAIIESTR